MHSTDVESPPPSACGWLYEHSSTRPTSNLLLSRARLYEQSPWRQVTPRTRFECLATLLRGSAH